MPGHDIIVIGASAGGVEALKEIVAGLPEGLPAAVFLVLHLPPEATSYLPAILGRAGTLTASHPTDGEPIRNGHIFIAPPDYHLVVRPGRVGLIHGPMENRHRPAVDPLFRSAARAYGPRVVGVVLTGSLDDGTAGLYAIKQRGGLAVVQDPREALYPSMPRSALEYVQVDYCVPTHEIPALLAELASTPAPEAPASDVTDEIEGEAIKEIEMGAENGNDAAGEPSVFTCPDCHGTLWEVNEEGFARFRCRVGHAWSAESMIAGLDESTERALWAALRALEESTALARRLKSGAEQRSSGRMAARYEARAEESERNASLIRDLLLKRRDAAAMPISGDGGE